ncbi:MAG: Chemotaxis protein methyltransferase CheR [Acidobacteria bacterium]|nr:Chemotaxis protein methyltransferase CheR [Acidobacteriota bacterium]
MEPTKSIRPLEGGGDMGALMRAHDWSTSALGPTTTWPQSLRTALSILLDSHFGMYIAWGRDYVQFYNDRYRPILGATKHPAIGKRASETFAESWHIIGPLFDQVMGGEAVGSDDWMLPLDRNGYLEECFFTFSYSPVRDESGDVGGVLVTVAETTARVLGERRLRTLRDLAARAAGTTDETPAWIDAAATLALNPADIPFALLYAFDEQGAGAQLASLCGLAGGSSAVPETIAFDQAPSPWPLSAIVDAPRPILVTDVADRVGPLVAAAWAEPVHAAAVIPITRPNLAQPYGALIVGISPRRAYDAAYEEFLTLCADHVATAIANARARAEEHRRAEALADLDRAKTAFFSNISHEFRTPLTLMLGPIEALLAGDATPRQRQELQLLDRNTQRVLRLVNTLLDFSRIEAGRIDAVYEPTDLAHLTVELASVFRSATERAGLRLNVDCPTLPEPLYVDRDMWEKIVLNLLSNALKFTLEGTIDVSLRWTGAAAQLTVTDTGVGIPDDELPRIFDRFHRGSNRRARTQEGSGIGLALAKELVHIHGGTIDARSRVGHGTEFVVRIPGGVAHLDAQKVGTMRTLVSTAVTAGAYVEEALRWLPGPGDAPRADVVTAAINSRRELDAEPSAARRHVLLVDDNADMREYVAALLRDHWQVSTAPDGTTALHQITAGPPDLIVTDIMMPGLDGFELLARVRQDPALASMPVIMLSARADEEARLDGLSAGADDYLTKPFAARELIVRIRAQLSLADARRAIERERANLYDLFMQAPAAICVVRSRALIFEMANRLYEELVGRHIVSGTPVFDALEDARGQGFEELLLAVMDTGVPHVAQERLLQIDVGRGQVEDRFITFIYAPMTSRDGTVDRVMVYASDVTEQVIARQALERAAIERTDLLAREHAARQDAEAANRAKDEFLAMLGHELRNPLSPIVTALQLMRLKDEHVFTKERAVIERQVRHVVRLVDDLLDVSRITRGKIDLRRKTLRLADIVAKAIEMASPMLESRAQRLDSDIPGDLQVDGDEVRLAQVVANLLTNASKYSGNGAEIETRATLEGPMVVLRVRDHGIGISAALLPRLFDLFVQGEQGSDRAGGGLGLGLTIVKSLTESHGGTVSASSAGPGQGSEFVVRLPAARRPQSLLPSSSVAPAGISNIEALQVLVVDDNRDAADLLAECLTAAGHRALVAYDGPDALELASRERPAVALLDIGLPVMDGYELAANLRALPGLDRLVLVAVTGYGQEQDRIRTRGAGFIAHLVKPVDPLTVGKTLEVIAAARKRDDPEADGSSREEI